MQADNNFIDIYEEFYKYLLDTNLLKKINNELEGNKKIFNELNKGNSFYNCTLEKNNLLSVILSQYEGIRINISDILNLLQDKAGKIVEDEKKYSEEMKNLFNESIRNFEIATKSGDIGHINLAKTNMELCQMNMQIENNSIIGLEISLKMFHTSYYLLSSNLKIYFDEKDFNKKIDIASKLIKGLAGFIPYLGNILTIKDLLLDLKKNNNLDIILKSDKLFNQLETENKILYGFLFIMEMYLIYIGEMKNMFILNVCTKNDLLYNEDNILINIENRIKQLNGEE